MEVKYDSLELTENEKKAIKSYIQNAHFSVNTLMDIDLKALSNITDAASIEFDKEDVRRNIEIITAMYSAMYKNTKKLNQKNINNKNISFSRGTIISEINSLTKNGKYNKMLSLTNDYKVASTFAARNKGLCKNENEKAVVANINIPADVPRLYVSDFAEDLETQNESEVVVSPFCKLEKIEKKQELSGIIEGKSATYYDITLKKDDDTDIDFKNVDENKIIDEYSNVENWRKEYDKIESEKLRLQNLLNHEDKDSGDIEKRINKLNEQKEELEQRSENLSKKMQTLIKLKFKEIEKNIDKEFEKEYLPANKKHLISEIDTLKNQFEQVKNLCINSKNSMKLDSYDELKNIGINIENESNDINNMKNKIDFVYEKLEENKNKLDLEIQKINSSDLSIDEINNIESNIESIKNKISDIYYDISNINYKYLPEVLNQHKDSIKNKVSNRVLELIKDDENKKIDDEIKNAEKKSKGIINRILGKRKFFNSKIEYLRTMKSRNNIKNSKNEYDINKVIENHLNRNESTQEFKNVAEIIKNISNDYISCGRKVYEYEEIPENISIDEINEKLSDLKALGPANEEIKENKFTDSLVNAVNNREIDMYLRMATNDVQAMNVEVIKNNTKILDENEFEINEKYQKSL